MDKSADAKPTETRYTYKSLRIRTGDECYFNKSTANVLADPRGVVMATNLYKPGPGLGNVLFGTAGLIGWALRLGRIPAVGCSSCFLGVFFQRLGCIDGRLLTSEHKRVSQWDGGYLPPDNEQKTIRGHPRETAIDFSLYFQASLSFQDQAPAVCSVLQPTEGVQAKTQSYWDATLAAQPLSSDPTHRRTVALHIRRGDYAQGNHPSRYGLLSDAYYESALRLIRARAALDEPDSADNLVAVVFTTQESVKWCAENLGPKLARMAKDVICANTSAFFADPVKNARGEVTKNPVKARCNGEEVDMLAMSLADYIIVANSTFSWWVHFFHRCRTHIRDWWSLGVGSSDKRAHPRPAYVFPPVWMNEELGKLFDPKSRGAFQSAKLGGGRTMLFNFLSTDYLIPDVSLRDVFQPTK